MKTASFDFIPAFSYNRRGRKNVPTLIPGEGVKA